MKRYAWNPDKNEKLKTERGISFEEIVFHIEHGDEVDILEHSNQAKYHDQKISVVVIEGYAYFVLYVETDGDMTSESEWTITDQRRYPPAPAIRS